MATELELREKQKHHLMVLLEIKKSAIALGVELPVLNDAILRAVVVMEQEDVALVEKVIEIKASTLVTSFDHLECQCFILIKKSR